MLKSPHRASASRTVALVAGLAVGCGSATHSSTGPAGSGGAKSTGGSTSSSSGAGATASTSVGTGSPTSSVAASGSSTSTTGSGGSGGDNPAGTTSSATTSATSTASSSSATSSSSSDGSSSSGSPTGGLHVSGNHLVDNGQTVRLLGVDHSGTEYACTNANQGFIDVGGAPADQQFVSGLLAWKINAVRVPLNEDCWLGINGFPVNNSGSAYQSAIQAYVSLLRQNKLYVIVDLHWNNGGGNPATGQQQMADSDHAPAFWQSVASAFKDDQGILFDLYNEPHDIAWSCWLNGGCQANGWSVAGMNQLISAVRGTGATNVLMAGGLQYSGDLSEWLANKPSDPMGNLAASFHSYNFSNCHDSGCWGSQLQPVAAQVPIITGELGENCDSANQQYQGEPQGADYINGFMTWADTNGVSYLGWAWNADFNACSGPSLNTNWAGTAATYPFGSDFYNHLQAIGP